MGIPFMKLPKRLLGSATMTKENTLCIFILANEKVSKAIMVREQRSPLHQPRQEKRGYMGRPI